MAATPAERQALEARCAERARTAADHPTWSVAYAEDVPMLLAEIEFLRQFVFQKCPECGLVHGPDGRGGLRLAIAETDAGGRVVCAVVQVPEPQRPGYDWRVRCPRCGWVDHFDAEGVANLWAWRHDHTHEAGD